MPTARRDLGRSRPIPTCVSESSCPRWATWPSTPRSSPAKDLDVQRLEWIDRRLADVCLAVERIVDHIQFWETPTHD
jgi:hypothetical protein